MGHKVTLAYYATFSTDPDLIAPLWRIPFGARPKCRSGVCWDNQACIAVGSWLPELEATYYLPSQRWKELIASHDRHIAVGGNVLTAYPFVKAKVPHLIWCASGLWADRIDRHRRMHWPLRLLDAGIKKPWLELLERRVLRGAGRKMCVSGYTQKSLIALGADSENTQRLPIPTDPIQYTPAPQVAPAGRVGFAGRINDPRKDIKLLIDAVALAVQQGADLQLHLAGDAPDIYLTEQIRQRSLEARVHFAGELKQEALPAFYQALDMFVIPSYQEGLCIAGVEAMASGLPVISTRCGGPEDYVMEGQTGFLIDRDVRQLASRMISLTKDRGLRARMSQAARNMAVENYSPAAFKAGLAKAWQNTWADTP